MAPTLLQKAKKTATKTYRKSNFSNEHIELAIAWAKDEVTFSQCKVVLNCKGGNDTYIQLLRILKQYVKNLK